jgi:hypothetical protein
MPKLNTTTSGIITATLTADSSPTLDLQENGVTFRTLGQSQLVSGVAVTASGTSVEFPGIPSWAKRITVMFNGVSLSGTSNYLIQLGTSGGVVSSGYTSTCNNGAGTATTSTAGFLVTVSSGAADLSNGFATIVNVNSNIWSQNATINNGGATRISAGGVTLSGVLDRVRITTVNGTDTFDAGSVNILYEG